MRKGRKPLLRLIKDEWCSDYHCAGDCGMRGNGWQHKEAVLAAFDTLKAEDRREFIDSLQEIRKKAKDAM